VKRAAGIIAANPRASSAAGSAQEKLNINPDTSPMCRWVGAAALLTMVLIVYIPVMRHGGFIWDDDDYIIQNSLLQSADGLAKIWFSPTMLPQYYPVVHTTFWIEYHLWGPNPIGYHVDNVIIHALCAILLWRTLYQLRIPGAWLAAALFAVHPVMVESVAWATERKNVLSLLFYLLALRQYLNFQSTRKWRPYAFSLLFFLAALLSKSVTCSLPAAILLLVYWQNGRIRWRDIFPLVPFFAAGLVMAKITASLEASHVGAAGPDWNFSFSQRCLIAGRAIWFYLAKLFWPAKLAFIYPHWNSMSLAQRPRLALFPLGVVAVIAMLWLLRNRIGRGPLVAVLFFVGSLLPALGFVNVYPMRYSFVADHFQYQAAIGIFVLVAACAARIPISLPAIRYAFPAFILCVLGVLTWRQQAAYADMESLWKITLATNPSAALAHNNLGNIYWSQGKKTDALAEFEEAYRLDPNFAEAINNIAAAFFGMGKFDQAAAEYRKAMQINPDYPETHYDLGGALEELGRRDESIDQYRQAIQLSPGLYPAHYHLGLALMRAGRTREAASELSTAVNLQPDNAEAHNSLAAVLWELGQPDNAIAQWDTAVRLNPDFPDALNALAWIMATTPPPNGNPPRAISLAHHACELTSFNVPGFMDTLAASYASAGRYTDALAAGQKAIALASAAGNPDLAAEIQGRLHLYQAGKPYVATPPTSDPDDQ
jgi:tetratricopeptide (TPR) repeat protein